MKQELTVRIHVGGSYPLEDWEVADALERRLSDEFFALTFDVEVIENEEV